MKIKFNADIELINTIERLTDVLNFVVSDEGIELNFVPGDKLGTSLKNGVGTIYYTRKHQIFRELGVFIQNAREKSEFEIVEDNTFKTIGIMLDTSRCAVPKISTINKMIDYLAVFGYNMIMLYTEDMIELEKYKYFGYMRGRYTKDDLKSIDDYAFEYGIEVIPCIECLGHMEKYLIWSEASPMRDTNSVLLAREEKTFEFVEEIIKTASSCFRSKRIHIGMDEATGMGKGEFMCRHGYVPKIDIFNEYMTRLISITNKYNLKPMMWSDMYFRSNCPDGLYYLEETVVPEETKKIIPKDVELVFWHYGEWPHCDEYMLEKHLELNRTVIFAGGLWSWAGHFPENNYALETTRFSLSACRKYGVNEMMTTLWLNDNAECDYFANLLGMSFTADLCYNEDSTEEDFKNRFEATTGASYEAFMNMSQYHNVFDSEHTYDNFNKHFYGKHIFWQDIMEGLYDTNLFENPMSEHYKKLAEKMKTYSDKWDYLYKFASLVFDYMSVKSEIAEKAYLSYKKGDRETLSYVSNILIPKLIEATKKVHIMHKEMWFNICKIVGWANLDVRYGGVVARCETAKMLIDSFLSGERDNIEEFDEGRLPRAISAYSNYSNIVTPNLNI